MRLTLCNKVHLQYTFETVCGHAEVESVLGCAYVRSNCFLNLLSEYAVFNNSVLFFFFLIIINNLYSSLPVISQSVVGYSGNVLWCNIPYSVHHGNDILNIIKIFYNKGDNPRQNCCYESGVVLPLEDTILGTQRYKNFSHMYMARRKL